MKREIKSFVLRQGRMTASQTGAFEALADQYCLPLDQKINLEALFNRKAPCTLEIGFGMGDSLLQMAEAAPLRDFIGAEVHTPGVGALLKGIAEKGLKNIRIWHGDVTPLLTDHTEPGLFDTIQIFFPDPWPKKKHHKRRLIQAHFMPNLARCLSEQGQLHLATDWENYAEHMMMVLSAAPEFENIQPEGQYAKRPDSRPLTKFEARGLKKGHGVWDLIFKRVNP